MKTKLLVVFVALGATASPADAEGFRVGRCLLAKLALAPATVSTLTATPGTISFNAVHPDSSAVTGSSMATVQFSVLSGTPPGNWTVNARAAASSYTGCPTVPASAVTVACASASLNNGDGSGSASCGGAFALSTLDRQVASGVQGSGMRTYTVQLNFTLAESWRYIANSACALSVVYTVNAL